MDPFGFQLIASVLAVPVAVVVTTVAQVAEAIALVPRADVPLATVNVTVPVVCPVPPFATGRGLVIDMTPDELIARGAVAVDTNGKKLPLFSEHLMSCAVESP